MYKYISQHNIHYWGHGLRVQSPPLPLVNFFMCAHLSKRKKNSPGIPTFTAFVFFPLTLYHYCQTHLIQVCAARNIHLFIYLTLRLRVLLWGALLPGGLFPTGSCRVVFSSTEWFGTEFREFCVPRNSRNSVGINQLFRLFRLPRNNFFVGNCQPYLFLIELSFFQDVGAL